MNLEKKEPEFLNFFPAWVFFELNSNRLTLDPSSRSRPDKPRIFDDAVLFQNAYGRVPERERSLRIKTGGSELPELIATLSNPLRKEFDSLEIGSHHDLQGVFDGTIRRVDCKFLKVSSKTLELTDCNIGHLSVSCLRRLRLVNCKVGRLDLNSKGSRNQVGFADVSIENTIVVSAAISFEGFRDIHIFGSKFAKRYVRSKSKKNRRLDLPLSRHTYASLHSWADGKGNLKLSHFARGHELSIEHAQAERGEKIFFVLWSLFSNYGLSLWRPIGWLIAILLLLSLVQFYTGTSIGIAKSQLVGWQVGLEVDTISSDLKRSVIGSIQGVFSPFSVFSTRRLIVPDHSWVAALQFLLSYVSVALLFLFGFSVRRRFKA